jgi:hypothetical protein
MGLGDGWLHEIKHDGIRIMARRDSAGVRPPVMTPTSLHGFPLAVEAVSALSARE